MVIHILIIWYSQPPNHLRNARHWWTALAKSPILHAQESPISLRSAAPQASAHDQRPSTSNPTEAMPTSRLQARLVAFVPVATDKSMPFARQHPRPTDRPAQPTSHSRKTIKNWMETLESQAIEKVHPFYLSIPSRTYQSARHALQHTPS